MRTLAFLLLLFLPALAFADQDFLHYSSAVFNVTAIGMIDYAVTGANPSVEDFSFQSFFVPQGAGVKVNFANEGQIVLGSSNSFVIDRASLSSSILYSASTSFNATASLHFLKSLELLNDVNYSSDLNDFLSYDDVVNPTPEMEALASKLVEGVKYKAEAVLRIVNFVHNYVRYDLEVGGNDLLSAQWVYYNKVGTCDEYSVLAAALLRSLKIPTRFVHGYVKADVLGGYGPHSYLEVYLSGEWVPMDPTWAQYGFVDVSHIKFLTSANPQFVMSSVSYKHRDASVGADNPSVSVSMNSFEEQGQLFTLAGSFDRDNYYEGDYAVLTLSLTSSRKDPVIVPLWISTTNTLERVNKLDYLLVKDGFRVVHLVFKTPSTKYPGVVHPVIVSTPYSNVLEFNVTNLKGEAKASYDSIKNFLENDDLVENAHVSLGLDSNLKFYGYSTTLNVTLLNDGNVVLNDLRISLPNHAQNFSAPPVGINQRVVVPVVLNYSSQGVHEEVIRIYQNSSLLGGYSFSNENVEVPVIVFDASYNYSGESYNLSVSFSSNINPKVSVLNMSSGDYSTSVSLRSNSSFLIPVSDAGPSVDLHLIVVDSFGKQYSFDKSVELGMSLFDKIVYYVKRFIKLLLYS